MNYPFDNYVPMVNTIIQRLSIMKRLITTLGFLVFSGSIFLFLFFAACSDDDENPDNNIDVVGFWTVSEVDIHEASVGNQSVVDFFINIGGMPEQDCQNQGADPIQ